jgi:recombination protein RecA
MSDAKIKMTPAETENRKKALDLALTQIEKQFGKGSIMKLDGQSKVEVDSIPTGSLAIDIALGVGGIPRGRVVEIYGPESSGKTTLTLSIIRQIQKKGGTAAFIDAEHAFDATYAAKIGVKLEDLLVSQPDTGEQALEIAETLVRSNAVDLVVVDSVAALTPKAEIEGDMGDSHMGLHARLMSQALRKLTAVTSKSNTTLIFINQIRMKIGVMFGNPETTTGGNALKFYASVRIDLRRIETLKRGEEVVGNRVRAKIVKNKVAAPFKEAEFEIHFDEGISYASDLVDMGTKYEVLEKSGAWFAFEGERIGQGRDNVRKYLQENPKVAQKLEKMILEKSKVAPAPARKE